MAGGAYGGPYQKLELKNVAPGGGFSLQDAVQCLQKHKTYDDYRLGAVQIHRGSFGRVYALCNLKVEAEKTSGDEKACKKIVKIIFHPDAEAIRREVLIFQNLDQSGLTPHIYDHFTCPNYYFLVLERWNTNILKRAEAAYDIYKSKLKAVDPVTKWAPYVFLEQDLLDMFRIAYDLSQEHGILHGDLKPDQFLVIGNKIVLTDFGLAGFVLTPDEAADPQFAPLLAIRAQRGWSWVGPCGHGQPLPPTPKQAEEYRDYFNVYQLWSWFVFSPHPVPILRNDRKTFAFMSPLIFPFVSKSHPYHVPALVRQQMMQDETQYGLDHGIPGCSIIQLPHLQSVPNPALVRPFVITSSS